MKIEKIPEPDFYGALLYREKKEKHMNKKCCGHCTKFSTCSKVKDVLGSCEDFKENKNIAQATCMPKAQSIGGMMVKRMIEQYEKDQTK